MLKYNVEPYLEDLENRLSSETEEALRKDWIDFYEGRFTGDLFMPRRNQTAPPKIEWPRVFVNEGLTDYSAMIMYQYRGCSEWVRWGAGQLLGVRSNYGTGILPSLFGGQIFNMADEQDTLPTAIPFACTPDKIKALLDAGIPDLNNGFGERVFEMGRQFVEIGKKYPKIGKYVTPYHPDTQGPMDAVELIVGSEVFMLAVDDDELVHQLLDLVTETYIQFMKKWYEVAPQEGPYYQHSCSLQKGKIHIRLDSAVNFSGNMYDEFMAPYDQRCLDAFEGGSIHFCGHGDQFIDRIAKLKGLCAINMSQPHLNDMEKVWENTVDMDIRHIDFNVEFAKSTLASGRDLKHRVHCHEVFG